MSSKYLGSRQLVPSKLTRAAVLKSYSLASAERVLATIEGFRCTHGHWPTEVQIPITMVGNIKDQIFTPRGWAMLLQKIDVKPSVFNVIAAQDAHGNTFGYGQYSYERHSAKVNMRADVWIWELNLSA